MTETTAASLHYTHEGTELIGHLVTEPGAPRPGVLLIHDAFGVSAPMKATARRIADLGYAVLLADVWGGGQTPGEASEIGPLIGSMVTNRERWIGRIDAAHAALEAHADVADAAVVAVGYCFGGASALEYLRHGGKVAGVVSFHGGLDTIGTDWSRANPDARVLVLTGAEDPMAPRDVLEALQDGLTEAGIDWEVAVYGATKHAFTDPRAGRGGRPDVIAYNARADHRSWTSFTQFLEEIHAGLGVGA